MGEIGDALLYPWLAKGLRIKSTFGHQCHRTAGGAGRILCRACRVVSKLATLPAFMSWIEAIIARPSLLMTPTDVRFSTCSHAIANGLDFNFCTTV
jgi:hypothetical protein